MQELQVETHEIRVKLENYQREYERYFKENARLKEIIGSLREEKEIAQSEVKRLKTIYADRVNEINDEANLKLAHIENQLIENRERNRFNEEKAYEIIMMQEKIAEKWKNEHRMTMDYYEKTLKGGKSENRALKEK